jgi:hypothetical protein
MVKNTIGGKKGKMLANKRSGVSSGNNKIRLSLNENEVYVCVSKVFGGGMFEGIDNDNVKYKVCLRGKMKGPNKRHNFVSLFSILLVGKRCDLSDDSFCDVLFVYDSNDIIFLSLLPNINLDNVISLHNNHSTIDKNNDDLFTNTNMVSSNTGVKMENEVEVDMDMEVDFNDI